MTNTREVLKFKSNYNVEEINLNLNNYLKQEKFVQFEYNGEQVLKWNSLYAKQCFYKTFLEIHINNNEITVIGWVTYKNKEYGFDEVLNLNDNVNTTKWEFTRDLYRFMWAICTGLKNDEVYTCQKVSSDNAIIPTSNNLFKLDLVWNEKGNVSVLPSIILDILSIFVFYISSVLAIVMVAFSISRIYKVAEFKNQNIKLKIVYILSILLVIIYFAIVVVGIVSDINSY